MTGALITVLNMSVAASIVAVAVMLARFPLKRAPKVFSYLGSTEQAKKPINTSKTEEYLV